MKKIIIIPIILLLFINISCKSDRKVILEELNKIDLVPNDKFEIINKNTSGFTDYILDFEIKIDTNDCKKIINKIESRNNFFIADSITKEEFIFKRNKTYPYKLGDLYFWEFYQPTKSAYEYYRIELSKKENILKFHYCEE